MSRSALKGIIPVTHDNTANDLKTDVGTNDKKWRIGSGNHPRPSRFSGRAMPCKMYPVFRQLPWSEEGKRYASRLPPGIEGCRRTKRTGERISPKRKLVTAPPGVEGERSGVLR